MGQNLLGDLLFFFPEALLLRLVLLSGQVGRRRTETESVKQCKRTRSGYEFLQGDVMKHNAGNFLSDQLTIVGGASPHLGDIPDRGSEHSMFEKRSRRDDQIPVAGIETEQPGEPGIEEIESVDETPSRLEGISL